jgi:hypothetical protein
MRLIHPNPATILYGGLSCAFSWFLFGDLAGLALRTHTLGPWGLTRARMLDHQSAIEAHQQALHYAPIMQ